MKTLITRAGLALSVAVLATSALAQAPLVNGEIMKLDKPAGRVTLKHGEIKNLDMPPMTMVFKVAEPRMLDDVAVGDRVRFSVERVNGQYTVTRLNKAP